MSGAIMSEADFSKVNFRDAQLSKVRPPRRRRRRHTAEHIPSTPIFRKDSTRSEYLH